MKIKFDDEFFLRAMANEPIGGFMFADHQITSDGHGFIETHRIVDIGANPTLSLAAFDLSTAQKKVVEGVEKFGAMDAVTDALIFTFKDRVLIQVEIGMPKMPGDAVLFQDHFKGVTLTGYEEIPEDFDPAIGIGNFTRSYLKLP